MMKKNVKMRRNVISPEDRIRSNLKSILNDPNRLLGPIITYKKILNACPELKTRNFNNIRGNRSESSEKVSSGLEVTKERIAPRIFFCDASNSPLKDCLLKDFIEAQSPTFEQFRDSIIDVVNKLYDERTDTAVSLDNILNHTKGEKTTALKYNKILIRIDAMRKKILLRQLSKGLADTELCKLEKLRSYLEFMTDNIGNIIIRLKGIVRQSKTLVSFYKNNVVEFRSHKRNCIPLSIEPPRDRTKSRVWFIGKCGELIQDNTEENDIVMSLKKNYVSSKLPTTIKVLHRPYDHLLTHEVNKAISIVNKFAAVTFKNRDNVFDDNLILKMAKIIKLPIKKKDINTASFRNREFVNTIKDQIGKYLSMVINNSNNYTPYETTPKTEGSTKTFQYKYFISAANNGVLVRNAIKQRPWWNLGIKGEESLNFLWTQWYNPKFIASLPYYNENRGKSIPKISNHFEYHYHISNKKAMFINMRNYYKTYGQDPFEVLPLTFHIRKGIDDPEFASFIEYYNSFKSSHNSKARNIWIIKPGEYSNRGCGISVAEDIFTIRVMVEQARAEGHTCILQKYIATPLLIHKRKFDIRMFGMVTSVNGTMKGYFYEDGYIRTSCKEYNLDDLDNKTIHLTNDAIQIKDEDYGKYECGNKLSFSEFQRYLDNAYGSLNIDFYRDLLPQIKVNICVRVIEDNN